MSFSSLSPAELKEVRVRAKVVLDKILDTTHAMVEEHPTGGDKFLLVLEATYRKATHTAHAVSELAAHAHLGSAAQILSRSLMEDAVSIEHMIAEGKEKKAQRFLEFYWIQCLQDVNFARDNALDSDPAFQQSASIIEAEAAKVKDGFFYKNSKQLQKNWSGIDLDTMLRNLLKRNLPEFGEVSIRLIARQYLMANRKTHFNPADARLYLSQEKLRFDYDAAMVQALLMTISCYVRLTLRYRIEISAAEGKDLFSEEWEMVRKAYESLADEV